MNSTNPLISPNEVIKFTSRENIELDPSRITLQTILSTQNRYIKPAIGEELYGAIVQGKYPELNLKYIKPALALFIARALISSHAIKVGAGGVAIPLPINHVKPSQREIAEIMNTMKNEARTLLKIAVQYIISSNAFPEFGKINSNYKTSTIGGLIIT